MELINKIFFKNIKNKGNNNKIIIYKNNNEYLNNYFKLSKKIKIKIKGNNNSIIIDNSKNLEKVNINIDGSNNIIYIGNNVELKYTYISFSGTGHNLKIGEKDGDGNYLENLNISCSEGENQVIKIGDKTTTNGLNIITMENANIFIGKDCMFGKGTQIWGSDTHTIIDKNTNQVINKQKNPLIIGDHCWSGENVKILKNTHIPNNTIIGIDSVVAGKYDEEFTILAGNPAKIVKHNVDFNRKRIYQYCVENN